MTELKEDYKTLILQRLQQRDMFVDRWQKIISDCKFPFMAYVYASHLKYVSYF
jgi:hypothetical protein